MTVALQTSSNEL